MGRHGEQVVLGLGSVGRVERQAWLGRTGSS
jgi:hypothetical protein